MSSSPTAAVRRSDTVDPADTHWRNATFDNNDIARSAEDSGWQYHGEWRMEAGLGSDLGGGNWSVASTAKSGAWVEFRGAGSAIYLYGHTGPEYSSASVKLDGRAAETALNLTSAITGASSQLLWHHTDQDPAHSSRMIITNLEDKRMSLDYVVLTVPRADSSPSFLSTLQGQLVVFLVVPLIALSFVAIIGIWLFRRYRRVQLPQSPISGFVYELPRGTRLEQGHSDLGLAGASVTTLAADMILTYEQGKKRLGEKRHPGRTVTPAPPYSTSALQLGSPRDSGSSAEEGWGVLLSPVWRFLHRQSRPAVCGNQHEGDMSYAASTPRASGFGTPTTASAGEVSSARYFSWTRATSRRGRLQCLESYTSASPPTPSPIDQNPFPHNAHPFAQFRGISVPPNAAAPPTPINDPQFDTLSIIAAPPSVRDLSTDRWDVGSVHTARSGREFFLDPQTLAEEVPALPTRCYFPNQAKETKSKPSIPSPSGYTGFTATAQLAPARLPAHHQSGGTSSARRKPAPRVSLPHIDTASHTFSPIMAGTGVVDPSPARPESVFGLGPLASPTAEAIDMSSAHQERWR